MVGLARSNLHEYFLGCASLYSKSVVMLICMHFPWLPFLCTVVPKEDLVPCAALKKTFVSHRRTAARDVKKLLPLINQSTLATVLYSYWLAMLTCTHDNILCNLYMRLFPFFGTGSFIWLCWDDLKTEH